MCQRYMQFWTLKAQTSSFALESEAGSNMKSRKTWHLNKAAEIHKMPGKQKGRLPNTLSDPLETSSASGRKIKSLTRCSQKFIVTENQ